MFMFSLQDIVLKVAIKFLIGKRIGALMIFRKKPSARSSHCNYLNQPVKVRCFPRWLPKPAREVQAFPTVAT